MTPKFGLFSPYTLRFHSDLFNEDSSAFLKRSFILFDELVYIEPRTKDKNFVQELIKTTPPKVGKELMKCFKPVLEFVNEEDLLDFSFRVQPESNMYYGPNRDVWTCYI